jgi:hypothetical protein
MMQSIYVAEYDGFTRDGTSEYVHAVHVGGERWFVELYAAAVYVRMGGIDFQVGFGWAEER